MMQAWIKCSEKLPEIHQRKASSYGEYTPALSDYVIVSAICHTNKGNYQKVALGRLVASCVGPRWVIATGGNSKSTVVRCWLPLPSPDDEGWITVQDSMPDENEYVIVRLQDSQWSKAKRKIHQARYVKENGYWLITNDSGGDVTHWMPFPDPVVEDNA